PCDCSQPRSHPPSMTIVRSGRNWSTVLAQWAISPGGLVRPTPGKAVCTTRQPEAERAAVNAGVAEYMPESPTIIAVPACGSSRCPVLGGGLVVDGRTRTGADTLEEGVTTTGARMRSVR